VHWWLPNELEPGMPTTIRDLMTPHPLVLEASRTTTDAAIIMREADVGAVLVTRDGALCGLLTDRDIVARVLAEGRDPQRVTVGETCSTELHALPSDAPLSAAISLVRQHAVRRIPVVDDGRPVGILSLGDLAVSRDPGSALADVSSASPNH
jgi:CBS domain-containing protein